MEFTYSGSLDDLAEALYALLKDNMSTADDVKTISNALSQLLSQE
jgi:hypothetical protein